MWDSSTTIVNVVFLIAQVSITDEHQSIPAGEHKMNFFDEEGYADLRKVRYKTFSSSSRQ